MPERGTLTVVGGSIAALVAADARLRRGDRVELLLPRRGVGGGFQPIEAGGRSLPLGVRLLEIDREDAGPPPPLADYVPGPGGHAPYVRVVAEWVRELAGSRLREAGRPRMVVDGRLVDDIYFTVDLDGLVRSLPAPEAARMAAEADATRLRAGDAGLLDGRHDLDAISLEDASRRNHGDTFHARFIASMCAKVHPAGAAAVPAALRRKVWMPLFHPGTLARAAAGRPTGYRPRRPFHTIDPGGMGDLVGALLERIRRSPAARVVEAGRLVRADGQRGVTRLLTEDGVEHRVARPVIGCGAPELFAAVGAEYAPRRLPMSFAWVEAAEADLLHDAELVHLPDPDLPAFRVSTGPGAEPGHRLLTLELRHDVAPGDAAGAARTALEGAGLVREGAPLTLVHALAGPAFPDPGREEAAAFAAARARLGIARLDAEVVGGAVAFGADSFNEQVIQGLRAEEATA